MIHFTVYDLLWLFFIYSFLGWLFETVSASLKQKKFANRGLVNGPFCVLYGITAVIITVGLQELTGIWLFLFAMIYATVVEWIAGHLIELAFKERWWETRKMTFRCCRIVTLVMQLAMPRRMLKSWQTELLFQTLKMP